MTCEKGVLQKMETKRKILRGVRRTALALILLAAVLLISRAVAMRTVYDRAVKNNAVSQLETLKLDGEEQSVLIEGKSEDNPVLIMLHGGPQSPIIYGTGYRGDTPELTEHFLVVYWDCWGCGKNFTDDTESATLERQVAMTCDLVRAMKAQYPGRKIYLFGYSNGTILTTSAAETVGDDLAGIINLGPITSLRDAQEMAYQALKTEDMSEWDKRVLEESYERNDLEGFSKLEEMVTLKTSRMFYWRDLPANTRLMGYFARVFYSPDYSLADIYHAYYASIFGDSRFTTLRQQIYEADEKKALENLEVPLLILQSEGDIYGSADYFRQLAAQKDNVTFIQIAESAHLPTNAGFKAINRAVIDFAR